MYQFTVNGKVFKFKTLKEARFMAQFNDGMTIISKINRKTKPLTFHKGTICKSS
jgi:hypothetical protein